MDLMEMALFSTSNDQQRPPSSVGSVPSQPRSCGPSASSIPSAVEAATGPTDTVDEAAPSADVGSAVMKCDDLRLTNSPAVPTELPSIDTGISSKLMTEATAVASESPKLVTVKALLTRPLFIPESPTALLDISMSAKQIVDAVSGLGRLWGGPRWCSLLPEGSPLPTAPEKPYPPPATNVESSLFPPTPCVYLNNRKDATSPELARYCLSQPVVVIRGLAACLRLDLGLFSTKSLVEANPDQKIEDVRFSGRLLTQLVYRRAAAKLLSLHFNAKVTRAPTLNRGARKQSSTPQSEDSSDRAQYTIIHDAIPTTELHGEKRTNSAAVSYSSVHFDRARVSVDDYHAAGNSGEPGKGDCVIIQGLFESPANTPKEQITADLEQFQELINEILQPSEEIIILKAFRLGSP
ncbi:unnamed protein product [Schistocephalus solidus]|uniref:Uncharacterized protein n=1 Tax=Schistocephalus solidus TaxID=70667 RepID=A0A3P7D803_SCHSO|nr:unnamed protein product [Schistocephalus solidus]